MKLNTNVCKYVSRIFFACFQLRVYEEEDGIKAGSLYVITTLIFSGIHPAAANGWSTEQAANGT